MARTQTIDEKFQFLVSRLSIAMQNTVRERHNFLTDKYKFYLVLLKKSEWHPFTNKVKQRYQILCKEFENEKKKKRTKAFWLYGAGIRSPDLQ